MTSVVLAALALPGGGSVYGQSTDARPAMRGQISATRYDGAGTELFWERAVDDRGVRGYEISVNGASVGIRDALSYYDRSLGPDRSYVFEVVAIDTAGQRSAIARVSLEQNADSATANASVTPAPAAPTDLQAVRYSSTAAELFWARPNTPGLRYDIARDGVSLGITDGVSYFDDRLPGTSAAVDYTVVAVDRSERRSAPASIVLRANGSTVPETATPTDPTEPGDGTNPPPADNRLDRWLSSPESGSPLSVANARAMLPTLVDIVNAEPARLPIERFFSIFDEVFAARFGEANPRFVAQSSDRFSTTFACPEGGTYVLGRIGPPDRADYRHVFEGCRFDGERLDGITFSYSQSFDDPSGSERVAVPGADGRPLVYVDADGVSFTLDGFYEDTTAFSFSRFLWGGSIDIRQGERTLFIESERGTEALYKTPLQDSNSDETYRVLFFAFNMRGTVTNGRTVNGRALDPLRTSGDSERYNSGLLVFSDAVGGQLTLTAAPSEPDGVTVRVDTNGRTDRFFEKWSDTFDFVRLPPLEE